MDIEGTYTLQATPEDVWKCLMDQQVLRRALPGVEQLEALGENRYAISLAVKQAPLKGSYQGTVTISEQEYPHRYHISVEGEGRHGPVRGEGEVALQRQENNTVIHYRGVLNAARAGTLLPPPLLKGTAKMLIQQFFLSLADQLRVLRPVEVESVLLVEEPEQPGLAAGEAPPGLPLRSTSLLHLVVRSLGLGGGDSLSEERWVRTLRRVAALGVLLLLVWVGTKLPRR
jgi:carbon monoxide dehydrogenase subunit G